MEFWAVFTWDLAEFITKQQQIVSTVNEDLNIIITFYIGLN